MRLTASGDTFELRAGDTVLVALARGGVLPAGCICAAGDCPNCLATIDGVAYSRMCLARARDGSVVVPHPATVPPELPPARSSQPVRNRVQRVDAVVIGAGASGTAEAARLRAEGDDVALLDSEEGDDALAIYRGPEVVARLRDGELVRFLAEEVVTATGASEMHPVCPGNRLAGILTPHAASTLAAAGVSLGRVVWLGAHPRIECQQVEGSLVRFEGATRVERVVVASSGGEVRAHPCDTVVVDLGRYPRNILSRMASGRGVRAVGGAAAAETVPPCPEAGVVCPCSGITVEDLDSVWERGFREVELIKRATLAGTGTCQGQVCTPYLRSFVRDRGGELQPAFTARPMARQPTMAEAAAGHHLPGFRRTALDAVHRSLGATMDRFGGWWRPWRYSDPMEEYWAVRQAVSLGDVSTLGKIIVRGPDVVEFLERLYPCHIGTIRPGRSRYALVLAESGGALDDGMVSRIDDETFALTFTTGGASFAEAWVRDWANTFGADVRIMDRTHSLGAINVTGPHAAELLGRAGLAELPPFMGHVLAEVAGIRCHVHRLSFTGEVSFELHHPISDSVALWEALMRLGADLGVRPHGLDALLTLRLEKGHVVIGTDTEPDSTPRRLGMAWAARLDKPEFVGRQALERTNRLPLDRQLVGLTMAGDAPEEGAVITDGGGIRGRVTSSRWSPALETSVMLGWVRCDDGVPPQAVMVDGRQATRSPLPFYDPEGARARA